MRIIVAGERVRVLRLNLSGFSDAQTAEVKNAAYDLTKGLFGPILERMKETSALRKQEGEACDLCLSREVEPSPHFGTKVRFCCGSNRSKE